MAGLAALLLRRVSLGVLTLLLVSLTVFATTQALPGDAARAMLGKEATPERLAALRERLHLDQPVWRQYVGWLGGAVIGDFGDSLATEQPVSSLIGARIGNSAFLVLVAGLIAVPLSLILGVTAAVRRDRLFDHLFTIASLIFAALPEFVTAISLILLFATQWLHLFPAVAMLADDRPIYAQLDQVILPAIALDLAVIPYMARIIRGSMIEVMESEYVQMARLKGLSPRRVVWRHALPNAIVPFVQVTALQLAWLAGGVVVIEFVFRYPGIGQALVDAVANRDLPVVQALTLLIGAVYVLLNVVADIATVLLTPRLRTAAR
jgi:peptide/nickel transport system permease protein